MEQENKSQVQYEILSNPRNSNKKFQLVLKIERLLFNEILTIIIFYKNDKLMSRDKNLRYLNEK